MNRDPAHSQEQVELPVHAVNPPVADTRLSGKLENCSDWIYKTGQRSVVGIGTTVS